MLTKPRRIMLMYDGIHYDVIYVEQRPGQFS